MDKLQECRENQAGCRQRAMYDPENAWKWLFEAEMWERRAEEYRVSLFEDCNSTSSTDLKKSVAE